MKMGHSEADFSVPIDMTPMIDVVFQLIIFFSLITDLTQREWEELQLPVSEAAGELVLDPKQVRPIVNVPWDGSVVVRRELLYDPEIGDRRPLEDFLATAARSMKKEPDPQSGRLMPDDPLLIRADEVTPFEDVARVMESCGKRGIEIWKIGIAAVVPEEVARAKAGQAALAAQKAGGR